MRIEYSKISGISNRITEKFRTEFNFRYSYSRKIYFFEYNMISDSKYSKTLFIFKTGYISTLFCSMMIRYMKTAHVPICCGTYFMNFSFEKFNFLVIGWFFWITFEWHFSLSEIVESGRIIWNEHPYNLICLTFLITREQ